MVDFQHSYIPPIPILQVWTDFWRLRTRPGELWTPLGPPYEHRYIYAHVDIYIYMYTLCIHACIYIRKSVYIYIHIYIYVASPKPSKEAFLHEVYGRIYLIQSSVFFGEASSVDVVHTLMTNVIHPSVPICQHGHIWPKCNPNMA